ncbi:MAG: hypothetical protein ACHQWU_09345 [Gemmatimonadales bacterium]
MTSPSASGATASFERLARRYTSDSRVSRGKMLRSEGLRVDGRFFAALVGERLLVKLPRLRVDELIADGVGSPFESGKGRVMKEWVVISAKAAPRWPRFADEALAFVR